MPESVRSALTSSLRSLLAVPESDREQWQLLANRITDEIEAAYGDLPDELASVSGDPLHEIRHYLADSDIRARDPEYAVRQRELIHDLIELLEPKQT